jgi:hypothetical protein
MLSYLSLYFFEKSAVASCPQNSSRYLSQRHGRGPTRHGRGPYLLVRVRVRPERHRAQSCAIALRSPAPERSSDRSGAGSDIHQNSSPQLLHASGRTISDPNDDALPPFAWPTLAARLREALTGTDGVCTRPWGDRARYNAGRC